MCLSTVSLQMHSGAAQAAFLFTVLWTLTTNLSGYFDTKPLPANYTARNITVAVKTAVEVGSWAAPPAVLPSSASLHRVQCKEGHGLLRLQNSLSLQGLGFRVQCECGHISPANHATGCIIMRDASHSVPDVVDCPGMV